MTTETIKVGNDDVVLDRDVLKFSEATINDFLSRYAALYDGYVSLHARAQYVHSRLRDRHETTFSSKVVDYKKEGGSDKYAECRAKIDPDVRDVAEKVIVAKHSVDRISGFLKAMDNAHRDCLEMCYNLRRELDKIYSSSVKFSPSKN